MPRSSFAENIKKGILTVPNVSLLLNIAIRNLYAEISSGNLPAFQVPGTNEHRVMAPDLLAYCKKLGMPIHPNLIKAVSHYNNVYHSEAQISSETAKGLYEDE